VTRPLDAFCAAGFAGTVADVSALADAATDNSANHTIVGRIAIMSLLLHWCIQNSPYSRWQFDSAIV